jgi:hypothetical protein
MRLFRVCAVLCLGRGLAISWLLAQGVLPSVKNDYGTKLEAWALNGLEEPLKEKCHFVHHISQITWHWIEPELQVREAGDCLSDGMTLEVSNIIEHSTFNNPMHVRFLNKCSWKSCYRRQRQLTHENLHRCICCYFYPLNSRYHNVKADSQFKLIPLEGRERAESILCPIPAADAAQILKQ